MSAETILNTVPWAWTWVHTTTGTTTHVLVEERGGPCEPGEAPCGLHREDVIEGANGKLCGRCRRGLDKWFREQLAQFEPLRAHAGQLRPVYALPPLTEDPRDAAQRRSLERIENIEIVLMELAPGKLEALWGNPTQR